MCIRDSLRDVQRRTKVSPLGSGALAGTTYPLDRDMVAGLLGFDAPTANSLDGVADRDFVLELLSALSILMVHLSRFAEEIILWCSWEDVYKRQHLCLKTYGQGSLSMER